MEQPAVISLLEKIARNTEQKTSFYILISDKSTRIKTKFNPLIQLDKTKSSEIALVNSVAVLESST
jgi:hypothetical protein